ncbi:hypothetical protein OsI_00401 [Oryza sativa Indica Group]|uniref:Uncharacterized protein n=1 Tax=Oryza sativa subsp. indica TaxID=39946 RepID=A2WKP0_ORYSI|nr:hypothetical protein OsI_00401 [Oryza sativa Indica Group]
MGMTRRRTTPHRCAIPVLTTSTPLVLKDADLLPIDSGGYPKSSLSRTAPHRCAVPMLAISTPFVLDDADLLPTTAVVTPNPLARCCRRRLASSPRTLGRSSASARGDDAPPFPLPRRPPLPPLLVCEAVPSVVDGGAGGEGTQTRILGGGEGEEVAIRAARTDEWGVGGRCGADEVVPAYCRCSLRRQPPPATGSSAPRRPFPDRPREGQHRRAHFGLHLAGRQHKRRRSASSAPRHTVANGSDARLRRQGAGSSHGGAGSEASHCAIAVAVARPSHAASSSSCRAVASSPEERPRHRPHGWPHGTPAARSGGGEGWKRKGGGGEG